MKMNLPNKLTIMRIVLVPICMFFIAFGGMNTVASRIIALVLFCVTSLTDMFDGKIARKRGLVTDFGKFLDPVADKLLIVGCYLALLIWYRENAIYANVMFWCLFVIFLRELGVTSLRMIVSDKVVVPANMWGKWKTTSQMVCVIASLAEQLFFGGDKYIIGMVLVIVSALLTLISGIIYFKNYFPYIKPTK